MLSGWLSMWSNQSRFASLFLMARIVVAFCLVWVWSFIMWSATPHGKHWYQSVAGRVGFATDAKAGKTVVHMAIPLLIAAIVSHAVVVGNGSYTTKPSGSVQSSVRSRTYSLSWATFSSMRPVMWAALAFLVVPWFCYNATFIHRAMTTQTTWNGRMMGAANAFGLSAILLSSVHMMLVTRQSKIWTIIHTAITPIHAIQMHIWAGRIIVLSVLVHGVMHSIRFIGLGESFWSMMIPPGPCWGFWRYYEQYDHSTNNSTPVMCSLHGHGGVGDIDHSTTTTAVCFVPTCNNPESDCSCYDHFVNLTGALAGFAMLLIGITSLDSVRRYSYDAIFYRAHVMAAPLAFVMMVLHWRKSILYVAGGLLYYAACNIPVWLELSSSSWWWSSMYFDNKAPKCSNGRHGGVRIVAVDQIPSDSHNKGMCVGVTIEATHDAWHCLVSGQYVRVHIPSISTFGHPFTINRVFWALVDGKQQPNDNKQNGEEGSTETELSKRSSGVRSSHENTASLYQMRLIFRVYGHFTRAWAELLTNSAMTIPVIKMEGFYGGITLSSCPATLDRHDVIVVIAGGIGITPYLSWFHDMYQQYCLEYERQQQRQHDVGLANPRDGDGRVNASTRFASMPNVILHWICRDDALIEYIEREYMQHWFQLAIASSSPQLLRNDRNQDISAGANASSDAAILTGRASPCMKMIIHRTSMRKMSTRTTTNAVVDGLRDDHIDNNEASDPSPRIVMSSGTIQRRANLHMADPLHVMPFAVSRYSARTTLVANLPFTFHLVVVSVLGIFAMWYWYRHSAVSNEFIHQRIWPLARLLLVCVISSYIMDSVLSVGYSWRGRGSLWITRLGLPVKWTRVYRKEHDDDDHDDAGGSGYLTEPENESAKFLTNGQAKSRIKTIPDREKEQAMLAPDRAQTNNWVQKFGGSYASHEQNGNNPPPAGGFRGNARIATLEYRTGRPRVEELLPAPRLDEQNKVELSNPSHPAVMACGPRSLMEDIRGYVRQWNGCPPDSRSQMTLYEEIFEL